MVLWWGAGHRHFRSDSGAFVLCVCCLWVSGSDSDEAELEQRAFLPLFRLLVAVQVASYVCRTSQVELSLLLPPGRH